MARKFKVVGTIDDNTTVLGSTYGQMKQVLTAGFEEQFRLQHEAARARAATRPVVSDSPCSAIPAAEAEANYQNKLNS